MITTSNKNKQPFPNNNKHDNSNNALSNKLYFIISGFGGSSKTIYELLVAIDETIIRDMIEAPILLLAILIPIAGYFIVGGFLGLIQRKESSSKFEAFKDGALIPVLFQSLPSPSSVIDTGGTANLSTPFMSAILLIGILATNVGKSSAQIDLPKTSIFPDTISTCVAHEKPTEKLSTKFWRYARLDIEKRDYAITLSCNETREAACEQREKIIKKFSKGLTASEINELKKHIEIYRCPNKVPYAYVVTVGILMTKKQAEQLDYDLYKDYNITGTKIEEL